MCGQSFLRVEKGYKETPRALPPDPQVIDRFSIQENRHCRFFLNRRPYSKGPEAPGDRLGAGLKKSVTQPRGRGPLLYRRGWMSALPPTFLKRTPGRP